MLKRIITLVLALVMVLAVFCSCAQSDKPEGQTTLPEQKTSGDEETTTSGEQDKAEVAAAKARVAELETVDYSNDPEYYIFARTTIWEVPDFEPTEYLGVLINDAEYERMLNVEARYKVDIINEFKDDGQLYTACSGAFLSGKAEFDVGLGGMLHIQNCARNGFLENLLDLPNLKLEGSWWDQKCIKDTTIHGALYFCTSDASINVFRVTFAIIYSKVFAKNLGIGDEELYELAANREWTVDKMDQYALSLYQDTGNGATDELDIYGIIQQDDVINSAISGAGCSIATINKDGELELSFLNDRMDRALNAYFTWAYNQSTFHYQRYAGETRHDMFTENRALFNICYMTELEWYSENMTDDYGILPYPMLDDVQDDYGHFVHIYGCSAFLIPKNCADIDRTTLILEAITAYSAITLTPAYYDNLLASRTVRDNNASDMLDIIKVTRSFDVGKIYNLGGFGDVLLDLTRGKATDYTSPYKTAQKKMKAEVNQINQDYEEATGN